MRFINLFKKSVLATFVLTLTLGFVACSDSDDDKEVSTKLIPKSITTVSKYDGEEETNIHSFKYNDKNQLTSIDVTIPNYPYPESYAITYDSSDRIIKIVCENEDPEYGTETTTSTYTYEDGKVIMTEGDYRRVIPIDKNGYLISAKGIESGYGSVSDIDVEYDKFYNLTKSYIIEQYKSNGEVPNTEIEFYETEQNYLSQYSPLGNINIPAWLLTDETIEVPYALDMLMGEHIFGKSVKTSSGQKAETEAIITTYKESQVISITKEENNYPITFKLVETDLTKTTPTVTQEVFYTVEYQVAK